MMDRWVGRVALVTGASAGIGASVARRLVSEGMVVVGVARRVDRIQALASELSGQKGKLIAMKCDITKDEEVLQIFAKIKQEVGGVDVCINNAGFAILSPLLEGDSKEWRQMVDLNVIALSLCTKEAVASMRERGVDDGHIIHINSVGGHKLSGDPRSNFYCGTKHMVTALTEGLRHELRQTNTNIRVSSVSPGLVDTEFPVAAGLSEEAAKKVYREMPSLKADDVTESIIHVLSAPPHVQIHNILIRPTGGTL